MKQYDIGLDLGTTSISIATQEQGIVFHQPSIGAVDTRSSTILAVGDKALRMVGRVPSYIDIIRPLRDGIIQDHRMTNELIVRFINEVCRSRIIKPRVSVCVPAAITGIEADAVVEAVMAAGARQVFLVDEPVAAALGAGLDIRKPMGCMVIDIGGGSTDIAVISLGGIVSSASLRVAGDALSSDILAYVKDRFNLMIGERSAEEIKIRIGGAFGDARDGSMEVRGRDILTGLPKPVTITTKQTAEAMDKSVMAIVDAVKRVLEETPPELAADIMDRGIVMTGGGALLYGLDELIRRETGIPAVVADDPLSCVAIGTGRALEYLDKTGRKRSVLSDNSHM